jgi:hypothetical protein
MFLWMLLAACVLHANRAGLVQVEGERVVLVAPEGAVIRLVPTPEGAPLRYLEGARVSVDGRLAGRRLRPRDFTVIDAGDGSAPFVGPLRRYGSNWLIDDRNSGATILLDEASLGELRDHEGRLVMVIGYVVGAQRVNVVMWKVLEPVP